MAHWLLRQVRHLYRIERELRKTRSGPQLRAAVRVHQAKPIYARLHRVLTRLKMKRRYLPRSGMGLALDYGLKLWSQLGVYVGDGHIEIDNNLCENAIRPTALGKKNWLFIGRAEVPVVGLLLRSWRAQRVNLAVHSVVKCYEETMRLPLAVAAAVLCLVLTGCNEESDAKLVLPSISEYFPKSVLYSFDKKVLWIQTDVTGISAQMAWKIYAESCAQAVQSAQDKVPLRKLRFTIQELMQFDQRSYLIIGFRGGIVAWAVRDGMDANGTPRGQVLGWPHAKEWLQEHIGYVPTPEQIQVVTLQEAEETPKGQPMKCQTLAQVQSAERAQQQAQIQDYVKKQDALLNP